MCRQMILQSPTFWLKLLLPPSLSSFASRNSSSPYVFGRNLQTALIELICPADLYSLPSLVEAVTAALFEHGAYPKVSLFWLKRLDGSHRVTLPVIIFLTASHGWLKLFV
jgi:hypothetical protein